MEAPSVIGTAAEQTLRVDRIGTPCDPSAGAVSRTDGFQGPGLCDTFQSEA